MITIQKFVRLSALLIAVAAVPLAAQQTGYLKTKVNPGRAGVFVDGKYLGPAGNFRIARKYPVAAGEHEVKLSDPRYQEVTTKVTITAGKTAEIKETLKPIPLAQPPFGRLRISGGEKFAAVYINGRFYGHAGEFNNSMQGLLLNPGDYTVKVVPPGADSGREEKVKIEADKVTVYNAK